MEPLTKRGLYGEASGRQGEAAGGGEAQGLDCGRLVRGTLEKRTRLPVVSDVGRGPTGQTGRMRSNGARSSATLLGRVLGRRRPLSGHNSTSQESCQDQ